MPTIIGTENDDTLIGGRGPDLIVGLGGDDLLYGREKHDTLDGGGGSDTLYGDQGDDALYGREGRDQLFGGKGDDRLSGSDGRDRLNSGFGDDTLFGGAGRDRFVYDAADPGGSDRIRDFVQGQDKIVCEGAILDADGDLTFIGQAEFSDQGQGEIRYLDTGDFTLVLIDIDGDGNTETSFYLEAEFALTADDFVIG